MERQIGKALTDAYYTRSKNIVKKCEELVKKTGANVNFECTPPWVNGRARSFSNMVKPAGASTPIQRTPMAVATQSPLHNTPRKRLMGKNASKGAVAPPKKKRKVNNADICAKCGIVWDTEEDNLLDTHWVQCAKLCKYWVHTSCCNIYYPQTKAGEAALDK